MVLVNFVTIVVLNVLDNLYSMQNTLNAIRAFQNGLSQLRDYCSFECIGQSPFHAKLFKYK